MSLLKHEKIILVGIVLISSIVIGLSFYKKSSKSNNPLAKGAPSTNNTAPNPTPVPTPAPNPTPFICDSCYYADSLCDNQNNDLDVKCTKFLLKNGDPSTQQEMCTELSMIEDAEGCQHCYHDLYQSDLVSNASVCAQYVPGNTPVPQDGSQADYNKAACGPN